MILICVTSCQSAQSTALPTPAGVTSRAAAPPRATQIRVIGTRPPTLTPTFEATPPTAPPPATVEPELLTQVAIPLITATLPGDTTLIGRSAGGRGLLARRFGSGGRLVLLVGGIHGGWEANTVTLANALIAHFAAEPSALPPGIALAIIPVANPDGLPFGRAPQGRFNGKGVDLNRNWGCGWQSEAYWRETPVSAGDYPFSEPETSALADFVQAARPQVILFFHSAAGAVYAGACPESPFGTQGGAASAAMAAVYGEAAGYGYGETFSAYPVSGTAPAWAAGLGIAAADVELQTWTHDEFERNLRAVQAVMDWLLING
jgi:predicted deacylase